MGQPYCRQRGASPADDAEGPEFLRRVAVECLDDALALLGDDAAEATALLVRARAVLCGGIDQRRPGDSDLSPAAHDLTMLAR